MACLAGHMSIVDQLKQAALRLSSLCDASIAAIEAESDVAHATNPLDYAWPHHVQYLEQWGGLAHQLRRVVHAHEPQPADEL